MSAQDRDSLIEEVVTARLLTHRDLLPLCEVIPYPDDLESLGKANKRGIVLVRAYQDGTNPIPLQGARRDKVREKNTVAIELRFLMFNRQGNTGCNQAREYSKTALAGFKPEISHKKYTVDGALRHVSGGLVGRVKGSKRWDYYDAYELDLIFETRPGDYPHA